MKTWRSLPVEALLLTAILPLQSAQAAVIYSFETFTRGSGEPYLASFSYVAPDFITSNTLIPTPSNCMVTEPSPSGCGPTQHFYADSTGIAGPLDLYDAVEFSPSFSNYYYYYFQNNAFGAFGTYDTVIFGTDQAARLTISASTSVPIPEPGGWAMMLVGFAVLGAAARRRRLALAVSNT